MGAILDITNPLDYIKALSQIMAEFERHTDESKQKMVTCIIYLYIHFAKNPLQKNIFRKTKTDNSDNTGDYGYLILPHIVRLIFYI